MNHKSKKKVRGKTKRNNGGKTKRNNGGKTKRNNGGKTKRNNGHIFNGGHFFNSRLLRGCSLDPPIVKFIKAYEQAGKSLDKQKHWNRFINEDREVLVDYLVYGFNESNECENEWLALKQIINLFSNANKDAFYTNYGVVDNSNFTLAYLHVRKSLIWLAMQLVDNIFDDWWKNNINGFMLSNEKPSKTTIRESFFPGMNENAIIYYTDNVYEYISADVDIENFIKGNLDTMKEIWNRRIITNINLSTALMYKTSFGAIIEMEWLIKKGAKVNLQDSETGHSPIFIAIQNSNVEKVKLLLKYYSDLNIKDSNDLTPLEYAKHLNINAIIPILEPIVQKRKQINECRQRLATVDITEEKKHKLCNAIIGIDDDDMDDDNVADVSKKWKEFTHIIFNDASILEEIYKTIKSNELCFLHTIIIKINDKIDPETVTDEMLYQNAFVIIEHSGKQHVNMTKSFEPKLYYNTNIEECKYKYMAIPITVLSHANMLIIHKDDENSKINVEHFEPHGNSFSYNLEMNKQINKYVDRLVYALFKGYHIEIIHPEQLCKLNETSDNQLQQLLLGTEFSGTCTIFSMWYSFYRLLYPSLSSDEVYRQMNNRLETSTNKTETIKMIIHSFLSLIVINIDDYSISNERKMNSNVKYDLNKARGIVDADSESNITKFRRENITTMEDMMNNGYITNIDIQDKTFIDFTALIYNTIFGSIETMRWLLEKGANVNTQDSNGFSAIFYAIQNNDLKKITLLLEHKPVLNNEVRTLLENGGYAKMIPIHEEAMKKP